MCIQWADVVCSENPIDSDTGDDEGVEVEGEGGEEGTCSAQELSAVPLISDKPDDLFWDVKE